MIFCLKTELVDVQCDEDVSRVSVTDVAQIQNKLRNCLKKRTKVNIERITEIVKLISRKMIEQLSEMVNYMPVEYKFVNLNDLQRNIARAAIYKAYKFIPDEKAWHHERLFPVFHIGELDGRGQVVVENRLLNPAVRQIPAWFDISFVEYNKHAFGKHFPPIFSG